jgi:hypothetical protein
MNDVREPKIKFIVPYVPLACLKYLRRMSIYELIIDWKQGIQIILQLNI